MSSAVKINKMPADCSPAFWTSLSRYTSCEWKIPDGRSCNIGPGRPECLADRDIHFNGNERNCSIRIDKIQIDQTGRWEVKLV